jgi:hypothetical protein
MVLVWEFKVISYLSNEIYCCHNKDFLFEFQFVQRNGYELRDKTCSRVNKFGGSIKDLDDFATQDFRNVMSMAHLPDVLMKGIAEMVLGKDLLQKAYEYLGYVEMAKSKIQNSSNKPPIETSA